LYSAFYRLAISAHQSVDVADFICENKTKYPDWRQKLYVETDDK